MTNMPIDFSKISPSAVPKIYFNEDISSSVISDVWTKMISDSNIEIEIDTIDRPYYARDEHEVFDVHTFSGIRVQTFILELKRDRLIGAIFSLLERKALPKLNFSIGCTWA